MPHIPSEILGEVYARLARIKDLSQQVDQSLKSWGSTNIFEKRDDEKKCEQIAADAAWIGQKLSNYLGTGDG